MQVVLHMRKLEKFKKVMVKIFLAKKTPFSLLIIRLGHQVFNCIDKHFVYIYVSINLFLCIAFGPVDRKHQANLIGFSLYYSNCLNIGTFYLSTKCSARLGLVQSLQKNCSFVNKVFLCRKEYVRLPSNFDPHISPVKLYFSRT